MIKLKFQKPGNVRVRIAPSPTGPLHLGTARTALFNFLFAEKQKGIFILRIEDTDIERSDPNFEQDILEGLKWLGIEWNEKPYKQSDRKEIYRKYLEKLLKEGKAYYCFCEKEELEAQKQYQISMGEPPHYTGKCSKLKESPGKPSVIRLKVSPKNISFEDIIRGRIKVDTKFMGDFVIAKDLESPLYNFASVVDDFEMEISHVIRGEDHISNTPRQILLQEALDFPRPEYAHLPLILGPDRTKLSKRHGAVSVIEYQKMGYLPEALINFMAFMGWNPGTEREIYSLNSLIKEFSLERVQKAGAVFNIDRLDYLNGFYIRHKDISLLTELCLPYLSEFLEKANHKKFIIKKTGESMDFEKLTNIVFIHQEKMKKLSEIKELAHFFFTDISYSKELLKWKDISDEELASILDKLENILSKIDRFYKGNIEKELEPLLNKIGDKGKVLWPFRACLTGEKASAGPYEIAEILGKDKTLERINQAKSL